MRNKFCLFLDSFVKIVWHFYAKKKNVEFSSTYTPTPTPVNSILLIGS